MIPFGMMRAFMDEQKSWVSPLQDKLLSWIGEIEEEVSEFWKEESKSHEMMSMSTKVSNRDVGISIISNMIKGNIEKKLQINEDEQDAQFVRKND